MRGSQGRWEGECRPKCDTNAGSETQDEEGCFRARSCGPLHADPIHTVEDQLEAHAEARTITGLRRGGDTMPRTPRILSKSRKVATAFDGGLLTLQTPMPESEAGSGYGPPPPDTTPAPLRENCSHTMAIHSAYYTMYCQDQLIRCLCVVIAHYSLDISCAGNVTSIWWVKHECETTDLHRQLAVLRPHNSPR